MTQKDGLPSLNSDQRIRANVILIRKKSKGSETMVQNRTKYREDGDIPVKFMLSKTKSLVTYLSTGPYILLLSYFHMNKNTVKRSKADPNFHPF
jgi:hypothetical protein